jgi:hypothetical protein
MRNKFVVLIALAAVVLAGLCLFQWRRTNEQKQRIAALQQAVEETEQQRATERARLQRVEKQRTSLSSEAQNLATEVQSLQRSLAEAPKPAAVPANKVEPASAGPVKEGMGGMLSKMMADPALKKMVREQQKTMMDMMYGSLIKEMALSPDETAKFKDLLLDKQMKAMEQGMAMLKGGGDDADKTEAIKTLSEEQKSFDAQMKEFLGEGRFAQYQEYNESLGQRMVLNQFQQQSAASDFPLRDDQTKQLLQVMKEESKNFKAALNPTDAATSEQVRQFKMMSSDEEMNTFFDQQEQANQRVLERSRSILSPEQLNSFGTFQTNQLNMQRFSINMARQMMGGEKTDAPVTPK